MINYLIADAVINGHERGRCRVEDCTLAVRQVTLIVKCHRLMSHVRQRARGHFLGGKTLRRLQVVDGA